MTICVFKSNNLYVSTTQVLNPLHNVLKLFLKEVELWLMTDVVNSTRIGVS